MSPGRRGNLKHSRGRKVGRGKRQEGREGGPEASLDLKVSKAGKVGSNWRGITSQIQIKETRLVSIRKFRQFSG